MPRANAIGRYRRKEEAENTSRARHTMAWARFFALPGEAPEREVLISITILWRLSTSSCSGGGMGVREEL